MAVQVTPLMHAAADTAMSDMLSDGYDEASRLISRNRAALESLLAALQEHTTLSGDQACTLKQNSDYNRGFDQV